MSYLPKEQRRAEIVEAAVKVIESEGIAAATVRRVANSICMSPGQIHHHFQSADDLRAEAFTALWLRLSNDYLRDNSQDSPVETIIALMTGGKDKAAKESFKMIYRDLLEASQMSDRMLNVLRVIMDRTRQQHVEMLLKAQDAGELAKEVDVDRLAFALLTLSFGSGFMNDVGLPTYDMRSMIVHQIELENVRAVCERQTS